MCWECWSSQFSCVVKKDSNTYFNKIFTTVVCIWILFFLNFFKENLAALYLLTLSAVPSLITYINSSIEYTCRIKSCSTKENRRYLALLALLLLTLSSSLLVWEFHMPHNWSLSWSCRECTPGRAMWKPQLIQPTWLLASAGRQLIQETGNRPPCCFPYWPFQNRILLSLNEDVLYYFIIHKTTKNLKNNEERTNLRSIWLKWKSSNFNKNPFT